MNSNYVPPNERFFAQDTCDLPCGAKDPRAFFPEAVHRECRGCREVIVGILRERQPPPPPPPAKQEPLLDGMKPRKLRDGR